MSDIVFICDETDAADLDALFGYLSQSGVSAERRHPNGLSFDCVDGKVLAFHDGAPYRSRLTVGWVFEDWLTPGLALLQMLEVSGHRVLNRGSTLFAGQNKALMSALLHAAGIPHGDVRFSYALQGTTRAFAAMSGPYVVKPGLVTSGGRTVCASGHGVCRISSMEAAEALHVTLQNLGQPLYAQGFIERPRNRDIRLWLFGNGAAEAIYKIPRHGDWITNTARGIDLEPCAVTPELYELGIRAAKAIGAQIAGLDIAEGANGLTVLEVNTCPTFLPAKKVLGNSVPAKFAEFLIEALNNEEMLLT